MIEHKIQYTWHILYIAPLLNMEPQFHSQRLIKSPSFGDIRSDNLSDGGKKKDTWPIHTYPSYRTIRWWSVPFNHLKKKDDGFFFMSLSASHIISEQQQQQQHTQDKSFCWYPSWSCLLLLLFWDCKWYDSFDEVHNPCNYEVLHCHGYCNNWFVFLTQCADSE